MVTSYLNLMQYPVKIKKESGEILNIEPNKGAETTKKDPFVKINYLMDQGWKKL